MVGVGLQKLVKFHNQLLKNLRRFIGGQSLLFLSFQFQFQFQFRKFEFRYSFQVSRTNDIFCRATNDFNSLQKKSLDLIFLFHFYVFGE